MEKFISGIFLVIVSMAQPVYAGNLSIFSREPTWQPGELSGQLVLGVNNTGAPHDLLGWQLRCEIRRGEDAGGSINFDPETPFGKPPNYVFGDMFNAIPGESSPTMLVVSDLFFGDPVVVPEKSSNVLALNLVASPGTWGQFDVVVIADSELDSGWFYEDSFSIMLPFDLPALGVVKTLYIPEPSAIALLATTGIPWGCFGMLRVVGKIRQRRTILTVSNAR